MALSGIYIPHKSLVPLHLEIIDENVLVMGNFNADIL